MNPNFPGLFHLKTVYPFTPQLLTTHCILGIGRGCISLSKRTSYCGLLSTYDSWDDPPSSRLPSHQIAFESRLPRPCREERSTTLELGIRTWSILGSPPQNVVLCWLWLCFIYGKKIKDWSRNPKAWLGLLNCIQAKEWSKPNNEPSAHTWGMLRWVCPELAWCELWHDQIDWCLSPQCFMALGLPRLWTLRHQHQQPRVVTTH